MNRLLFTLAAILAVASPALASTPPQPVRMLENVYAPPEAVAATGGGPAVLLVGELKSRVTLVFSGGGGGAARTPEPGDFDSSSADENDAAVYWLDGRRLIFLSIGAVAGLGALMCAALWAVRRMKH